MRLPDFYYTQTYFDGYPAPPGKPVPIEKYTGEDIVFDVYLNYCGKPILTDDWDLTAVIKSNQYAHCTFWEGKLNSGIYKNPQEGYFKFFIPSEITEPALPGTYWLEVKGDQKLGRGDDIKDITIILFRVAFTLSHAVTNPDPPSIIHEHPEQTAPNIVDITQE
jgi:hypothetical protein